MIIIGLAAPIPAPAVIARIALTVVGALLVLSAVLTASLVRRVSVTLTGDAAILRWQRTETTVPRSAVTGVDEAPRIFWTDERGRKRSAWLTGLSLYRNQGHRNGMNGTLYADLVPKLATVRAWAGLPDASAGPLPVAPQTSDDAAVEELGLRWTETDER